MFTSQLNLSGNHLCGVDAWGQGTYTTEGITAIADALKVTAPITSLNLASNNLCDLCQHCGQNWGQHSGTKCQNGGQWQPNTAGVIALAEALKVTASLTSLIIHSNHLGDEGMGAIAIALKDSTVSQLASLDVRYNKINLATDRAK